MGFTEAQMESAINQEGIVQDSVKKIACSCYRLQQETGCPDEDIDDLLNYLVGRWKKYN